MSKYTPLDQRLYEYLLAQRTPDDELLVDLQTETQRLHGRQANMQISPDQGTFLTMIARLMGARRAVEVGTFTGYSSICIARGLGPDGRLLALDISPEFTDVARRYWKRGGLDERIELRLGPAADTLRGLPHEVLFDLAFIDADKGGYLVYYEEILARLRPGGLILADNVLWSGRVAQDDDGDPDTQALRRFNQAVMSDARVESVMLALADGLLLARKR